MLNIKDPEAHRLAQELAEAEGTTMTGAVTQALRDALSERHRQRHVREQVLLGLIAAARSTGTPDSGDAFAHLYDEKTGLPA